MANKPKDHFGRLLPLTLLALMMATAAATVQAKPIEPSPFDKAALADAKLATLRGGFDLGGSVTVPFGIQLDFAQSVNGSNTATLAITNHGRPGPVEITEHNINMTIPITPATTVTTSLTTSGIRTVIQNDQSNLSLQAAQRLNAVLTALPAGGSPFHNTSGFRSMFH